MLTSVGWFLNSSFITVLIHVVFLTIQSVMFIFKLFSRLFKCIDKY